MLGSQSEGLSSYLNQNSDPKYFMRPFGKGTHIFCIVQMEMKTKSCGVLLSPHRALLGPSSEGGTDGCDFLAKRAKSHWCWHWDLVSGAHFNSQKKNFPI